MVAVFVSLVVHRVLQLRIEKQTEAASQLMWEVSIDGFECENVSVADAVDVLNRSLRKAGIEPGRLRFRLMTRADAERDLVETLSPRTMPMPDGSRQDIENPVPMAFPPERLVTIRQPRKKAKSVAPPPPLPGLINEALKRDVTARQPPARSVGSDPVLIECIPLSNPGKYFPGEVARELAEALEYTRLVRGSEIRLYPAHCGAGEPFVHRSRYVISSFFWSSSDYETPAGTKQYLEKFGVTCPEPGWVVYHADSQTLESYLPENDDNFLEVLAGPEGGHRRPTLWDKIKFQLQDLLGLD